MCSSPFLSVTYVFVHGLEYWPDSSRATPPNRRTCLPQMHDLESIPLTDNSFLPGATARGAPRNEHNYKVVFAAVRGPFTVASLFTVFFAPALAESATASSTREPQQDASQAQDGPTTTSSGRTLVNKAQREDTSRGYPLYVAVSRKGRSPRGAPPKCRRRNSWRNSAPPHQHLQYTDNKQSADNDARQAQLALAVNSQGSPKGSVHDTRHLPLTGAAGNVRRYL